MSETVSSKSHLSFPDLAADFWKRSMKSFISHMVALQEMLRASLSSLYAPPDTFSVALLIFHDSQLDSQDKQRYFQVSIQFGLPNFVKPVTSNPCLGLSESGVL
ncbi:MAG: hypothetical protein AAF304_08005 [Pseudomonadota bacterium]